MGDLTDCGVAGLTTTHQSNQVWVVSVDGSHTTGGIRFGKEKNKTAAVHT